MAEGALAGSQGGPRRGELPAEPGAAGGDTEAGRRGEAVRHSDGDGSPDPAGDCTGADAAVRAGVFTTTATGFGRAQGPRCGQSRPRGTSREGYDWVVDIDLEKFFDRVNHDKLMARVARVVKDKRVLKLIRAYLESGVMVNGVVMETEEGTPQGGPLSPLLANIMLDDLDKELEQRGHRFVRYADDCNIYVRSRRAGERVMASVERFLSERAEAEGQRAEERGGPAVEAEVPGLQLLQAERRCVCAWPTEALRPLPSQDPATDETHAAGTVGGSDPGSQSVHDGLDRLLPAVRCQERVRGAGRMAAAAAAATGLEALEARHEPAGANW